MFSFLILKLFTVQETLAFYVHSFAATCGSRPNFFGFPAWYKYLEKRNPQVGLANDQQVCSPHITGIGDVWLIGLAIVEIILRIAVIAAIIYVMIGGMKYVNARGNAEKTESAKKTVIDALMGLIIAVSATAVISYIGGRFGG